LRGNLAANLRSPVKGVGVAHLSREHSGLQPGKDNGAFPIHKLRDGNPTPHRVLTTSADTYSDLCTCLPEPHSAMGDTL
jgi:hypothetical protein